MTPRVHDLLLLTGPDVVMGADDADGDAGDPVPEWVVASLDRCPWVVTRRPALEADGLVAIGVRGDGRAERWAGRVRLVDVVRTVRPETLTEVDSERTPAVHAVAALRRKLMYVPWGPVGSVGFELATGYPATTEHSDLDVAIREDRLPARHEAVALLRRAQDVPVRVDVLVETPEGAAMLSELASPSTTYVLRTSTGPQLANRPAAGS